MVLSVCWLTWCIHKASSVILAVLAEMAERLENIESRQEEL